ncbi:MAG: response regulator transcription factor [Alistipes sp.]|nr:response regulator transcription factor [Alistipes sp.]
MIRCLAIDDEPLALRQITGYIEKIPFLELARTFNSAVQAQQYLLGEKVDLIFVDINMPDLNGVDFVRSLESPPMIIFTTAYSEYAIEGFKLDAIDYLLKPFGFNEFSRSVNKANSLYELLNMKNAAADNRTEAEESESSSDKEYISVRADYKTSLIKISNIVYLESEGEYVRMNLNDGTKVVTLFRLKNMESSLPSDTFMRVHRSYIVNLKCITGYTKGRIFLENDDYVPIGENYKEAFLKYIGNKF